LTTVSGQRVFVVDDEPVIASTLAMILNSSGFDTASFTDPSSALEAALVDPPDMLISDIVLPLFSGVELAKRVKHRCLRCKVLLFSGHVETAAMLEEAWAQAHQFELLPKPIHPTVLLNRVRSLMEGGTSCA